MRPWRPASRRIRCDRCGHQWRQAGRIATPSEVLATPEVPPKPDRATGENLPKFLSKRDPRGDHAAWGDEPGLTERRHSIGMESQARSAREGRGLRGWIVLLVVVIIIIIVLLARRGLL